MDDKQAFNNFYKDYYYAFLEAGMDDMFIESFITEIEAAETDEEYVEVVNTYALEVNDMGSDYLIAINFANEYNYFMGNIFPRVQPSEVIREVRPSKEIFKNPKGEQSKPDPVAEMRHNILSRDELRMAMRKVEDLFDELISDREFLIEYVNEEDF